MKSATIDPAAIVRSRPAGIAAGSDLEAALAFVIRAAGLPEPDREYHYVPGRKLRADFAWPEARLLVECQGGIYTGEAHGSVSGVLRDIERGNLAVLEGYRMLRVTGAMIKSGEAIELIERALHLPNTTTPRP